MDRLVFLPDNLTLNSFYQITISIAGILLPVFQAVLFFIVEKSFAKFEYSRQQLVKFYKLAGKLITASLLLLILLPIFELLKYTYFSMLTLILFVLYFSINRTRLFYETGLWTTINSTKFIPSKYGNIRKFFRTCRNNNLGDWINFILWNSLLLITPIAIYICNDLNYSNQISFYTVLVNLIYVLITISSLLNNPVDIQQQILKSEDKLERTKTDLSEDKIKSEESKINGHIKTSSLYSRSFISSTNNKFQYLVNILIKPEGIIWCNVVLQKMNISSVLEVKNEIKLLSRLMLLEYLGWATDLNNIAISWHFKLDGKGKNVFVRSDRDELEKLKSVKNPDEFFSKLKNTLIDDILN